MKPQEKFARENKDKRFAFSIEDEVNGGIGKGIGIVVGYNRFSVLLKIVRSNKRLGWTIGDNKSNGITFFDYHSALPDDRFILVSFIFLVPSYTKDEINNLIKALEIE